MGALPCKKAMKAVSRTRPLHFLIEKEKELMTPLAFYYVDMKYVRNLSRISDKVPSVSPQIGKDNRPFLGVITVVGEKTYCIPITSPKEKYKRIKSPVDMIKIFDESRRGDDNQFYLIGVLNINNMIPVSEDVIEEVDIAIHKNDSPEMKRYKELMQNQLSWCRDHEDTITKRANKVYLQVTENPAKSISLTNRCLPYLKMEQALRNYLGNKLGKKEKEAQKKS